MWGQWDGCVNREVNGMGVNSVGSMGWVFYQCGVNKMGVVFRMLVGLIH